MALEQEAKVYQFQLGYGEMLLKGFDADKAFNLICDGGVHPAWIIGHLGFVANRMIAFAGGQPMIDLDAMAPLLGGGSKPASDDASRYPSWDELLDTWRKSHDLLAELAPKIPQEKLDLPNASERMRPMLPTMHGLLSFVLTGHEGMHLGQLSTWRRVQGLAPLF